MFSSTSQIQRHHGGLAQFCHEEPCAAPELSNLPTCIDFSVNINPYGPAVEVLHAIQQCDIKQYPDPQGERLKILLGEHYSQQKDQSFIIGNGAVDLIWNYCQTWIQPGSPALIFEPTFSEFRFAAEKQGARVFSARADANKQFAWNYEVAERCIEQKKVEHLYVCHPNSPTGTALDLDWLSDLGKRFPKLNIILDLAFANLSMFYPDLDRNLPVNVFKLISLTKDHSIPGVRLGFALGQKRIIQAMEENRPSWSINSFALAAGAAALHAEAFIWQSREKIRNDQNYLLQRLKENHFSFHSAHSPMVLLQTGSARQTQKKLWQHRILVRNCESYGLPEWIRIFPRPKADVDLLIKALK
ncbi:MAG: pyridoxal phosphate-dependent aminotransferase [Oligoflexus sp.]